MSIPELTTTELTLLTIASSFLLMLLRVWLRRWQHRTVIRVVCEVLEDCVFVRIHNAGERPEGALGLQFLLPNGETVSLDEAILPQVAIHEYALPEQLAPNTPVIRAYLLERVALKLWERRLSGKVKLRAQVLDANHRPHTSKPVVVDVDAHTPVQEVASDDAVTHYQLKSKQRGQPPTLPPSANRRRDPRWEG